MLTVSATGSFPLCARPNMEEEARDKLQALATLVHNATETLQPNGLLLTGSFARGEGVIICEDGLGPRWLSDVECLLVFPDDTHISQRKIDEVIRRARCAFDQDLARHANGLKIDLSPIRVGRLARMRPAIFTKELTIHGKLLWGDPAAIRMPPDVPDGWDLRHDALRLLNNRIVEHLRTRLQYESPCIDRMLLLYSLNKFWEEMTTSLSVFLNLYAPSYRERSERLAVALGGDKAAPLPEIGVNLQTRLAWANAFRFSCVDATSQVNVQADLDAAATTAEWLWWWETSKILGANSRGANWREIGSQLRRVQTRGQVLRDWARLVLRCGARGTATFRSLPEAFRAGSFGSAVYAAALAILFFWDDFTNEARGHDLVIALSRFLGVAAAVNPAGRTKLAERTYSVWANYLRGAAA